MRTLSAEKFERCSESGAHGLILDEHWRFEICNPAATEKTLLPYMSGNYGPDLGIYVAGKSAAPNSESLTAASIVLSNLNHYLSIIGQTFSHDGWTFTAIYLPYSTHLYVFFNTGLITAK